MATDDALVGLWHPLDGDIGSVTAWRRWLERHEVTQPFKQAHRDVYLLTHAERETGTYSNRFAAHVLRQHQFAALCRQRGWRYTLQGVWDSHNVPSRDLPGGALRAEFWVEPPADSQVSQAGVQLYLATDQVRFVDRAGVAQPLADIPPRVFSEVMRDIDLFVGVSGMAADPTWQDHGDRPGEREYWRQAAFGDLSVSAQTRREVLAAGFRVARQGLPALRRRPDAVHHSQQGVPARRRRANHRPLDAQPDPALTPARRAWYPRISHSHPGGERWRPE